MAKNVRHEGKRAWIDGIDSTEPMATNETTPNTTMAAFALAIQAAGEDITYEYLMGVSGSAFRFQLAEGWCVTSTISHCGHGPEAGAIAAMPYEVACFDALAEDADRLRGSAERC